MIDQKQSQIISIAENNRVGAFRAQQVAITPAMPVAIARPVVGASGRTKAVRTPHWLSGFVTSPATAAAAQVVSPAGDRSANNIATWSSYLPADCVRMMVSLGWDRTT
jgi:hypothetical protein